MNKPKKVALAYSGGLDTSVIIPWLKENYGCDVVAVCGDIGQGGDELTGLEEKALRTGASEVHVADMREEFVTEYLWKLVRSGGVYEHKYLLGTSIARPLLAKKQVEVALATGCDGLAHGCTGKGNDQVRFRADLQSAGAASRGDRARGANGTSSRARTPSSMRRRTTCPSRRSTTKIYSRDRNIWHISHEGGALEDPANAAPDDIWMLTRSPREAPG
jgi:argininosuccinate synthase